MTCNITDKEMMTATPLTHEVAICEMCDNPVMFSFCETIQESVCMICHLADLELGIHEQEFENEKCQY